MAQQFHSWVSKENKNTNLRRCCVDQNVRLDFSIRCYKNLNKLFGQSNICMEFPGSPGVRTPMLPLQGVQVWSLAKEQRSQNPWSTAKKKTRSLRTLMFIAGLFTIAKIWKQPKCPSTGEQIKKMLYTYTYIHSKEFTCNVGDLGSITGLGRFLGERHSNPLRYSCQENPHGQRNLVGYSPLGHKESDTTERLSTA